MKTYIITAVLSVGPYIYTEYLSLSKTELVNTVRSWERNDFQILRATIYYSEETISVNDYNELFGFLLDLDELEEFPIMR